MNIQPSGNADFPLAMEAYFDADAPGYDEFTREHNQEFLYEATAQVVDETDKPIRILDIGIGTGFELDFLFHRAPNARVVGLDVSSGMLDLVRRKHAFRLAHLELIRQSIFEWPIPQQSFDYVLAIAVMHHYLDNDRQKLYRRILEGLRPEGVYIEADKTCRAEREDELEREYLAKRDALSHLDGTLLHLDVPRTRDRILRTMAAAGMSTSIRYDKDRVVILTGTRVDMGM